jgi:hypothetical protein
LRPGRKRFLCQLPLWFYIYAIQTKNADIWTWFETWFAKVVLDSRDSVVLEPWFEKDIRKDIRTWFENVLGPVPGVDVMAKRPQGLLNVGTLSARMAVLRSCALDM